MVDSQTSLGQEAHFRGEINHHPAWPLPGASGRRTQDLSIDWSRLELDSLELDRIVLDYVGLVVSFMFFPF